MPYIESQLPRDVNADLGGVLSQTAGAFTAGGSPAEDCLTGLPTLREFYRQAAPIVEACLNAGEPVAVAIVDIDHLQRINDGHCMDVGDRVITSIARHLKGAVARTPYLVARLGEEEFGLLLVRCDDAAATEFCETLRQDISGITVNAGDADVAVSVSIGVAEIYGPETFDNYLNAAEQFLFMAKCNGRNQVFSDHTMLAGMH
jgi:diguanylate cyclase (GGDEF)-like protein